jgi:hypothetical protein
VFLELLRLVYRPSVRREGRRMENAAEAYD